MTVLKTFRQSRFYIAVLLVASCILFFVMPDLTFVLMGKETHVTRLIVEVAFQVSSIVDAVIYIFMDREIRKVLRRMVRPFRRQSRVGPQRREAAIGSHKGFGPVNNSEAVSETNRQIKV